MSEIAAGTKVFSRADRLSDLLDSIERTPITHVYVADDGEDSEQKEKIYNSSYEFDFTVIEMEYDAGLGAGRAEIVQHLEEEYLLIVDTDHEVPEDVATLQRILDADGSIGGVAGNIIEPELGRMYQNAHDLYEKNGTLVRHTYARKKEPRVVQNHSFVPFNFIPNAAMFRRECLTDYTWDPKYVIEKEHLDFYVGHWKQTEWQFGICPEVCFRHYPGGSDAYVANRHSSEKGRRSERYFLSKWGYDGVRSKRNYWFDTRPHSLPERAVELHRDEGLGELAGRTIRSLPHILRERIL